MRKQLQGAVIAVLSVLVAACGDGGIGDGNRLERLQIVKITSVLGVSSNKLYLCFRENLQLQGVFTDGSIGDFSARGNWTSSDPVTIAVSNGDIQVPGQPDLAFASGTLIPKRVSTAPVTISAEFVGLRASTQLTVGEPTSITLAPASQNVAISSVQALKTTAVLDGFPIDVTGAAAWSFVTPNISVAAIGPATGVVTGLAAGGPLTAQARYISCQDDPTVTLSPGFADDLPALTSSITVAKPQSLDIAREFAGRPDNSVIIDTTEALKVTANFGPGLTQDLSTVAVFTSSDATKILTSSFGVRNIVRAIGVGSSNITAAIGTGTDTVTSPVLALQGVEATLQSIAITPHAEAGPPATVPTLPALDRLQFRATGTFSGSRTQDVSRHVVWTTNDSSVAVVSNAALTAGLLLSTSREGGCVTLTATADDATVTKVDSTKVQVGSTPCP